MTNTDTALVDRRVRKPRLMLKFTAEQIDQFSYKGGLSKEHVEILRLHTEGLTYTQMAERTGQHIGTMKSRLNRAKLALLALQSATQPEGV